MFIQIYKTFGRLYIYFKHKVCGDSSFYDQISVNNNDIAGGNYFINPGYNDGGAAGDNSVGYKTKIVFEKDNVQNKTNSIPKSYSLSQNYPNPFNPTTNLEFGISNLGFVTLKIYNMLGKEVAIVVNENLNPGTYRYKFDGSNLSSGIYFYRLTAGDFIVGKRMVLLK